MTTTCFPWGRGPGWLRPATIRAFFAISSAALIGAAVALPAGTKSIEPSTVQAAGRGNPFFNFRDGGQVSVAFHGENAAALALQSGQAEPRAVASGDFDGNGTPDVIAGYA